MWKQASRFALFAALRLSKTSRPRSSGAKSVKPLSFITLMDLFHDYVRGGIEVMYEQFTDGCQTQDDYLRKTYEVMTTFKKELEGISYADELAKLIR